MLIPFFVPEGMSTIGLKGYITNAQFLNNGVVNGIITFLYRFRNLIGIFALLLFLLYLFRTINYIQYYPITTSFLWFALWVAISSKINSCEMYEIIILLCFCVGYLFLFESMLKKYPVNTVKVIQFISRLLLIMNLSLMMLFPHGITTGIDYLSTPYWFMGTKNQVTPFLILALIIEFYNRSIGKIGFWSFFDGVVLVLANAVGMGSSTSILTTIVITLGIVVSNRSKIGLDRQRLFVGKLLIGMVVAVSMGIVFLGLQNVFKWLIVDILGKDLSLSGRTETWRLAVEQVKNNPIIGYGYGHKVTEKFYAHNAILEMLITTGLIGLVLYINMVWKAMKQINAKRKNEVRNIAVMAMASIILANITEAFLYNISQLTIIVLVCHWFGIKEDSVDLN